MKTLNSYWPSRLLAAWKYAVHLSGSSSKKCSVEKTMQPNCGGLLTCIHQAIRTPFSSINHQHTQRAFLGKTTNLAFQTPKRQFSIYCNRHPSVTRKHPRYFYLSTCNVDLLPAVSVCIVPTCNASVRSTEIGAKIRGIQKDISPLSTKRIVRRKRPKDAMPKDQAIFEVTAYSTAEEYNLETLKNDLERQGLYQVCPLPRDAVNAMHVSAKYRIEDEMREIFFFREGSVVFWNMPDAERQMVLKFLQRHQEDSYNTRLIQEEFEMVEYSYTDTLTSMSGDEIQLKKSDHNEEMDLQLEKFTFANALALSVKLSIWEASLAKCVDSYESLFQDLKDGKKLKVSRSEILRIMGELYTLRHLVNLSSDLLDTPDFYWDRPRLEQLYTKTIVNFSVPRRVKVINEKLNLSCEMMNLLFDQKNDEHHTRLEWMIIILILIEVLFEIAKLLTGHG